VPASKAPDAQSIPERVFNFFKGFGLEVADTVTGLGDVAKLLNDANPLLLPTGVLADMLNGKSFGQSWGNRTGAMKQVGQALLTQSGAVMRLASDLSMPEQMTNFAKMLDSMVRDMLSLHQQGKLTPGMAAQVIAARTGQNPSLQAAQKVAKELVNMTTNAEAIFKSGGDPVEVGRGAFRLFSTLVDFAKPAAKGVTAALPEQTFPASALKPADQALLSRLSSPGSSAVVPRSEMPLEKLAQLTKEAGREFAVLTRGNERMIIAGDAVSVPLMTPERVRQLSAEGWKLTAHSHVSGLTPSVGDANVLAPTGQQRSIIVDSNNGRISYTPKEGQGGRTDSLSTGAKTLAQSQEAARTLRAGGAIDYVDPVFQNVRANGLGTPGQYNLDGATTMLDVARRNTSLHTGGATLNATPHDITHATMAGAGGHMNNTVYPDGVSGLLVVADNFTMKDFMGRYGGDVRKIDFEQYIQDNYLAPAIDTDPGKFVGGLQKTMDENMARFEAHDLKINPDLRPKAVELAAQGTRRMMENSQEYGFLNYANYRYEGVPRPGGSNINIDTPRSLAIKEVTDAAWKKVIDGYSNQDEALKTQGIAELRELQMREMISNVVPKQQAAMALKDHITYHELLAEQYMATYPGKTKADYYTRLGDRFNARNEILQLKAPSRQEFDTKRRELFPNG
jgi:hypothetical protein